MSLVQLCSQFHPEFISHFQPLLRDAMEKNPDMNEADAIKTIDACLKVLFYRDARSLNRVSLFCILNVIMSIMQFSYQKFCELELSL